jgi:hypothetical protein
MKRFRWFIAVTIVALVTAVPAMWSPAQASHNCNLPEETADRICDGYHDIPGYVLCKVAKKVC